MVGQKRVLPDQRSRGLVNWSGLHISHHADDLLVVAHYIHHDVGCRHTCKQLHLTGIIDSHN